MPNTKVKALGLTNTAVTAGSYTSASITVDAQGRITSASSGSAGAGMGIPVLLSTGPASGTYTASPTANRIGVYMYAGGGGGSGGRVGGGCANGGRGGNGGYGFYNKPITQPFSQPYSVGAGGVNPGPGTPQAGVAGGNTTLANVGTVNGGSGANAPPGGNTPGNAGTAGTAPGASLGTYPAIGIWGGTAFQVQGPYYPSETPASYGIGGGWGRGACGGGYAGQPGGNGLLLIFENTGT
jgi:hypothetical protein